MRKLWAPLEWGGEIQASCMVDEAGRLVDRLDAEHGRMDLAGVQAQHAGRGAPTALTIAAGRPRRVPFGVPVEPLHPVTPGLPFIMNASRGRIEHDSAPHPEGRIVMSGARAPNLYAARIVAAPREDPRRVPPGPSRTPPAGVAPVLRASATQHGSHAPGALDRRQRQAITGDADKGRRNVPPAEDLLVWAWGSGCARPCATRLLAKAWTSAIGPGWKVVVLAPLTRHLAVGRRTKSA